MSRLAQARVEIYGDDSRFQSAVKRFQQGTGKLSNYAGTASRGMIRSANSSATAFRNLAGVIGTTAIAFGGLTAVRGGLSTISEFGSEISKIEALTQATSGEMGALTAAARELGATTQFSATEAAAGMAFLAQAGFDTNQILKSSPSFLKLAAAGGTELAESMDIASNVLAGFGLGADQASRVADVLASTASSAKTDVSLLGSSFRDVAPVVKLLNLEIEDVAAAIGQMGQGAIQGGKAGTALRAILTRLSKPTAEVERGLSSLNLALEDVSPASNSLADVFGTFEKAVESAGLSASETTAAFAGIFGQEALGAGAGLVQRSSEIESLGSKLRNAEGEAARMAKTMNDNLLGDTRAAKSAFDDLVLTIGASGLTASLRERTQGFTTFTRALSRSGVIEEFAGRLGTVKSALEDIGGPVLENLRARFSNLSSFVGAALGDIDGDAILESTTEGFKNLNALVANVSTTLNPAFEAAGGAAGKIAASLADAAGEVGGILGSDLTGFLQSINLDQFFSLESLDVAVTRMSGAFDVIGRKGTAFIDDLVTGFHFLRNAFQKGEIGNLISVGLELAFKQAANFGITTLSAATTTIGSFLKTTLLSQIQLALQAGSALFSGLAARLPSLFEPLSSALATDFSTAFSTATTGLSTGLTRANEIAGGVGTSIVHGIEVAEEKTRGFRSTLDELSSGFSSSLELALSSVASSFGAFLLDAFANVAVLGPSLIQKTLQEALEGLGQTGLGSLLGLDNFEAQSFSEIQKDLSTTVGNLIGVDNLRAKAQGDLRKSIDGTVDTLGIAAVALSEGAEKIGAKIQEINAETDEALNEIKNGVGSYQFDTSAIDRELAELMSSLAPGQGPQIETDFTGVDAANLKLQSSLQDAADIIDVHSKPLATETIPVSPLNTFDPSIGFADTELKNLEEPKLKNTLTDYGNTTRLVESEMDEFKNTLKGTNTALGDFETSVSNATVSESEGVQDTPPKRKGVLNPEASIEARLDRQSQADLEKAGGRAALRDRINGNALAGRSGLDFLRKEPITDISESGLLSRELDSIRSSSLGLLRETPITDISQSDFFSRQGLADNTDALAQAADANARAASNQRQALDAGSDSGNADTGPLVKMLASLKKIETNTANTATSAAQIHTTLDERLPTKTI